MTADIDGLQVRFGPLMAQEHVAHAVQAHGHPRILGPLPEQRATVGVGVGQGLAVVAASNAKPDLGHLHQAVPQPTAIDPHVGSRCRFAGIGHLLSFLSGRPVLEQGQLDRL